MDARDVAIVILAAGNARRFGSDKLMADLNGAPLGLSAAQVMVQVNATAHIAVCQPDAAIAEHYAALGYEIAENARAELGLSGSLHVAVEAAERTQAHALLITLADMPFVLTSHINALILTCEEDIVASFDGAKSMPPAIFPRSTWPLLLATRGDSGARHILASAIKFMAPPGSLRDIDTPDDMAASKAQPLRIDPSL